MLRRSATAWRGMSDALIGMSLATVGRKKDKNIPLQSGVLGPGLRLEDLEVQQLVLLRRILHLGLRYFQRSRPTVHLKLT
jgi:hypothetical protein